MASFTLASENPSSFNNINSPKTLKSLIVIKLTERELSRTFKYVVHSYVKIYILLVPYNSQCENDSTATKRSITQRLCHLT
jgi:hypothetical protein